MTGCAAQCFDKCCCICVKRLHIVATPGDLALTLTTMVESDAAIFFFEQRNLLIEHPATPEKPVRKEDGFGTRALFLIIDFHTIDACPGHPLSLGSVALLHSEPSSQISFCKSNFMSACHGNISPKRESHNERTIRCFLLETLHDALTGCGKLKWLLT